MALRLSRKCFSSRTNVSVATLCTAGNHNFAFLLEMRVKLEISFSLKPISIFLNPTSQAMIDLNSCSQNPAGMKHYKVEPAWETLTDKEVKFQVKVDV